MTLAIDGSSPAGFKSAGSVTAITSASFTPPANALLVVGHIWNDSSASGQRSVDTISDSQSLTWTEQVAVYHNTASFGGVTGQGGGASIWTATVTSSVSMTVTLNDNAAGGKNHAANVWVVTDTSTPTIGAVNGANGTASAPTLNLSSTVSGSLVFAASEDYSAAGTSGASYTPASGYTADEQDWVSGQYGGVVFHSTSTIGGGTQTVNVTAPSSQTWNLAAIEVKAIAVAGLPDLIMAPRIAA